MQASQSNAPELGMAGMNGWDEKSVAEMEVRAADLRQQIERDPQRSPAELADVEWEIEKRNWRNQP